ncbi:outer membrane beta-barrel protein [Bradyrhizobium sp. NP1]|uniref:outer membrane protein n=1 Tax=Bradyrhizobium sp. NP1 TaxID=3049772 RepID=UPI0025A65F6E|nr:outer membrane beta-barrel protein [Bradyrhizobium sp. NP1]WJR74830.1 outer membrane beta-barrel protein [Bradyrhizobium sp. NP1]
MKGLSLAAAIVGLFSAHSVLAADLPVKAPPVVQPVFSWGGWYVGLNAGGIWDHNNVNNFITTPATAVPNAIAVAALAGNGGVNGSGFAGGAQVGYNWMVNRSWMLGLEADIQGISMSERRVSGLAVAGPNTGQDFDSIRHNWLATFRARGGYAFDRALVYVTGGLAVGDASFSRTQTWNFFGDGCPADPRNGLASCHVGSSSNTLTGGVVGVGGEYAFWGNWSAKVEYLHTWLSGSTNFITQNRGTAFVTPGGVIITAQQFNQSASTTGMDLVRVGVNYRFGQ